MLFGKSSAGDHFSRVISTNAGSGTIQEEIPKGSWTFSAVAWSGPSSAFTGNIICDFAATNLTEDEASINLTLSNSKCFDSTKIVTGTNKGMPSPDEFNDIDISVCEGSVAGMTSTACNYTEVLRPIQKGFAGSYKMHIPAFRNYGGNKQVLPGEYLESRCYNTNNNAEPVGSPSYFASELNIPVFLQSVGFPMEAHAYLGSACEDAKGYLVRSLLNPDNAKLAFFMSNINFLHLSTPASDLCAISNSKQTVLTPASGNGTLNSPWLICSEQQLLRIQNNFEGTSYPTNVKDGVYVLGRDMDLLRFIKGGDLAALQDACLPEGDTFVPIGKKYNVCALTDIPPSASFQFDGNNYTIKHFRFRAFHSQVGFFSNVFGKVYDVNFSQADVEGNIQTGVAIGNLVGGTAKMIKVSDSRVEGNNETGGVIGNIAGTSSVYQLHATKMEVEGEDQTGGVVGKDTTSAMRDLSFDGTVYSDGTMQVGGVVGMIGANLEKVTSSGVVRGSATSMGGIAGSAGSITYARSNVLIKDYNNSTTGIRNFGGIAGSASNVARSFFMGQIKTACITTCNIGSMTGNAATFPDSYTLNMIQEGTGVIGNAAALSDMRSTSSTFLGDLNNADTPPFAWTQLNEDFPRLAFELNRPCASTLNNEPIATQVSALRGTLSNPITVCRDDQLGDLELVPAGRHVSLKQDVYISNYNGVPTFSGHFNGEGRIIHSYFSNNNSNGSPFIGTIATNSSFHDTKLAGFKIFKSSGCSSCLEGGLAGINQGTISNVLLEDLYMEGDDLGTEIGGVVHENTSTGKINHANVYGDFKSLSFIGGIAYKNSGQITYGSVDAEFNLRSAVATNVGGIAGINQGEVFRSIFKGQIDFLGSSSVSIGGIVGSLEYNTKPPKVVNNEVDSQSTLILLTGVTDSGGVVGYSDNVNNVVARNITNGFIFNQGAAATIKPIVGNGLFTDVVGMVPGPNKAIATDYLSSSQLFDAPLSTTVSGNQCLMVIDSNASGYGSFGALYVANQGYFMGPMTEVTTVYTMTVNLNSSKCTSLNGTPTGNLGFYFGNNPPDTVTPAGLKALTYDLVDMISVPADRDRAFLAYTKILKGVIPDDVPVWVNDEEGIGLFFND